MIKEPSVLIRINPSKKRPVSVLQSVQVTTIAVCGQSPKDRTDGSSTLYLQRRAGSVEPDRLGHPDNSSQVRILAASLFFADHMERGESGASGGHEYAGGSDDAVMAARESPRASRSQNGLAARRDGLKAAAWWEHALFWELTKSLAKSPTWNQVDGYLTVGMS